MDKRNLELNDELLDDVNGGVVNQRHIDAIVSTSVNVLDAAKEKGLIKQKEKEAVK